MNLIPQVKKLVPSRGTCRTDVLTVLNYAGLTKETLMLLRERFPKLKVKKEKKRLFCGIFLRRNAPRCGCRNKAGCLCAARNRKCHPY